MNHDSGTNTQHSKQMHIPLVLLHCMAIVLSAIFVMITGHATQLQAENSSTSVDLQVLSTSIASDGSGNTYYADTAHSLIYKTSTTGTQTQINCCAGLTVDTLNKPRGVALDSSGNLYIADTGNNRIVVISPSLQVSLVNTQLYQLSNPSGLALDADDDLYIADSGNNRIIEVSSGGQIAIVSTSTYRLSNPLSVSVDDNNNLYITDTGNNRIIMISASGSAEILYSNQLNAPLSITPNANGSAYIAQTGSSVHPQQTGGSELPAVVASFGATNMNVQQGDGTQGSTASVNVTLTPLGGYSGTLYLGILGLPPNTEAKLTHPVITLSGISPVTETLEVGEVPSGQYSTSRLNARRGHFPWQSKRQFVLASIAPFSLLVLIGLRLSGKPFAGASKILGIITLLMLLPSLAVTTSGCKGGYPAGLFGSETYTATLVAQSANGQVAYSLGSFGVTVQ